VVKAIGRVQNYNIIHSVSKLNTSSTYLKLLLAKNSVDRIKPTPQFKSMPPEEILCTCTRCFQGDQEGILLPATKLMLHLHLHLLHVIKEHHPQDRLKGQVSAAVS
jgi:hypothetical protein